jgi:hypothetical protein
MFFFGKRDLWTLIYSFLHSFYRESEISLILITPPITVFKRVQSGTFYYAASYVDLGSSSGVVLFLSPTDSERQ